MLAVSSDPGDHLGLASAQEPPRVDKETLKSWLSDPQVLILDVRAPKDWHVSDKKIKGAVRQDPKEVKTWAASLPKDKKIVLYAPERKRAPAPGWRKS